MRLSILCITRAEACVLPFLHDMQRLAALCEAELVIAADGRPAVAALHTTGIWESVRLVVNATGYLESVHDEAVAMCEGEYVLRLDDDERPSAAMITWLRDQRYCHTPHWRFPRVHLWSDPQHYLANAPLWPDYQTRLSVHALAGGRSTIHCASPHGRGTLAPVALEHYKFLIRSYDDRVAIADRYERIARGAGRGKFLPFQLPEDAFPVLDIRNVEQYEVVG